MGITVWQTPLPSHISMQTLPCSPEQSPSETLRDYTGKRVPFVRSMTGKVALRLTVTLCEQEAAKEERKRKAAAAKLVKQAQQAQQALQQMPGVGFFPDTCFTSSSVLR